MKQKYGYTVYVFAAFVVAAALFLALYPVDTEPQAALARDIPGVNTPVVTARLVETRTTRTEIALPVIEIPIAPPHILETPQENTATFYFQPPDAATFYFAPPADPVVEAPPAINLVVLPDVTYRLEPLKEQQPGRLTLVH